MTITTLKQFIASASIAGLFFKAIDGVSNAWLAMGIVYLINIFIGIRADAKIHKKDFSFSKFRESIEVLLIFSGAQFFIIFIGILMDDEGAAIEIAKWVTYVIVIFTGINILKNLKQLYPNIAMFAVLYDLLTFALKKKTSFLNKEYNENT